MWSDPVTQQIRYGPLNYCIYCGEKSGLTKEHVIPFALAANFMVAEKASCAKCCDITKKFEEECCHLIYNPFRIREGLKSRRPKKTHVRYFKADLVDGLKEEVTTTGPVFKGNLRSLTPLKKEVEAEKYNKMLLLPIFPPPGALIGFHPYQPIQVSQWWKNTQNNWTPPNDLDNNEFSVISTRKIVPLQARLIAKIAHCFACCKVSRLTERVRLLLPEIIRGNIWTMGHVIGGGHGDLNTTLYRFSLSLHIFHVPFHNKQFLDKNKYYLICKIRLFSDFGTPIYYAVVGEITDISSFEPFSIIDSIQSL